MEYVEGQTLAQRVRAGPVVPNEALGILEQLAGALDFVHDCGVVHRDLKPANVLLGRAGRLKLADLGLASAAEASGLTTSGIVLGTPAYIAPEQFEGRRATRAADVYSLAAVAFELFAGRRARLGATAPEMALRATREPPPNLRDVRSDAPELARALGRGMARRPEDRPPSAGALVAELRTALARDRARAEPTAATAPVRPVAATTRVARRASTPGRSPQRTGGTHARPARVRTPTPPPASRRGRLLPALLIAVMALVAGAIVAVVLGTGRRRSEPAARAGGQPTRTAPRATAARSAQSTSTGSAASTAPSTSATTTRSTPSASARSIPSASGATRRTPSASRRPSAGAPSPATPKERSKRSTRAPPPTATRTRGRPPHPRCAPNCWASAHFARNSHPCGRSTSDAPRQSAGTPA
jgi:serine/threonine protein kinase